MGSKRTYPPTSATLSSDRAVLRALQDIPDYAPHNLEYSTAHLIQNEADLLQIQIEVDRARLAFDAVRERLIVAAWTFHNNVAGAKDAFVGQFGADSPIVHAIGLKKKSERKRAVRRPTTTR